MDTLDALDDVDPVSLEIHRLAIENLTNEMATTMVRTSGSPVVYHGRDFCTSFMDAAGEQLSLSAYVLLHSATSMLGARAVIAGLAAAGEVPEPGDGWILNDPYTAGAVHQGDVGILMPTFHDGAHIGWGFANMHLLDVGGSGVSGFAPGARTVYEEGVRFPPTKVIRHGAIDREWERFLRANVRMSESVLNDIRSMVAANNIAQDKLVAIVEQFGLDQHLRYSEVNKALTESLFRKRIAAMADGTYRKTDWVEFDGHGPDQLLDAGCTLEVHGSDLRFAFSGAPQIDAFINASEGAILGQTMTTILTVLSYGDLPFNAGMWRPLNFDYGPPGTIVNCVEPAPVSASHAETGKRIGKLTKNVLCQAIAESNDPLLRARLAGQAPDGQPTAGLFGLNQDGKRVVIFHMDTAAGSGGGAQTINDGLDCYGTSNMSGCGLPDVELHEAEEPLLFLWRRVGANSGGPGQLRGGLGLEQAYAVHYTDRLHGWTMNVVAEAPPLGFGGGYPGGAGALEPIFSSNVQELFDQGRRPSEATLAGRTQKVPNKAGDFAVERHDVLRFVDGGGGGVGDPLLRDPALVARDVRAGYITVGHARAAYGVVTDEDGRLDAAATATAREAVRHDRIGRPPSRPLRPPADIGVAVVGGGAGDVGGGEGDWRCGHCDEVLGPHDGDWREVAVVRQQPVADRYRELEMRVQSREESPILLLVERFCPACAGCLVVETTTETEVLGVAAAGSPR